MAPSSLLILDSWNHATFVCLVSLSPFGVCYYIPHSCFAGQVPTVLVVGATGEMGRVVVRKLLLRGEVMFSHS